MDCHTYQREMVQDRVGLGPILNAACKEDPANLSQFGVTNLDICTHCEMIHRDLRKLPNFVLGSVLDMSKHFEEGQFKTIVLGEFLEHVVEPVGYTALHQCRGVLHDDGQLVLTFPLDDRPPEAQHAKRHLKVWVAGETGHDVTVWHQLVWTDAMLEKLFAETGFTEISRTELHYGFIKRKPAGWGVLLAKTQTV